MIKKAGRFSIQTVRERSQRHAIMYTGSLSYRPARIKTETAM